MVFRVTVLLLLLLSLPGVCVAAEQELSFFAGMMHDTDTGNPSYAWQLEFRDWMYERFAVSLGYLNEGHVAYHHRDGGMLQAWTRTELFMPRLFLDTGIGPYYYFDTTQPPLTLGYENEHGWGVIGSIALSWRADAQWFYQLRANLVQTRSMDTQTVLLGVGYLWDVQAGPAGPTNPKADDAAGKNELTLLAGRTIVNSFKSEHAIASGVEYRRRLGSSVEGSVGVLDEGSNALVDRTGVEAQLWLEREIPNDHFSLGIGGGVYLFSDREHRQDQGGKDYCLAGILSLTASWRVAPDWNLRATWSRTHTHYDRDTDVILLGPGYLF